MIDEGCTPTTIVNSGVTRPKFTKFSHDVVRSLGLLMRPSALRYFTPFWNARATNEGE